jgi:alpha/beta superfamily hydrolase
MSASFLAASLLRASDAARATAPQEAVRATTPPEEKRSAKAAVKRAATSKPAPEQTISVAVPATDAVREDAVKGMLSVANTGSPGAALVLHANPLRGGAPGTQPVPAICSELQKAGWSTLRFQLRKTENPLAQLEANLHDANAALDQLVAAAGAPAQIAVVGYSWGSLVGHLLALSRPLVTALALVAPPLALYAPPLGFDALAAWRRPTYLLVGDQDGFCPLDAFAALRSGAPDAQQQRTVVPGANHFFANSMYRHAASHVGSWASALPPPDAACSGDGDAATPALGEVHRLALRVAQQARG